MSVQIGLIDQLLPAYLAHHDYSRIAVIVDKNTKKYAYPRIKDLLPKHLVIQVNEGEEHKNIETCIGLWSKLTEAEFDRHSLVVNLGGGVIGDMGGFAAATYKRGIDFIQIPTTLLAQVDASVGGKLGIDFQGFKNHIGVFTRVSRDPAGAGVAVRFCRSYKTLSYSRCRKMASHTQIGIA
jgi:3-dehydroquinate synthase